MSTPVPPRDGDAQIPPSPGSSLPDEAALRLAFLAEYSSLSEKARADLGAEAAGLSAKVVEGAFVRAWDARAQLRSPAQLKAFLVQDVHHAAARALSRRMAAHRFSSGGGAHHDEAHIVAHAIAEADAEQSWSHIMHALHGETHSPQALADAAATSRHEAAEHIATVTRETSIVKPLAIGAIALAAVIGIGSYVNAAGADARVLRALSAADVTVHSSLASQIGIVTLRDGSKVRLAPESKLTIPSAFGDRFRAVKLEGTATFTVAKGSAPFAVLARNAMIVATGTVFTVRAYPGDSSVTLVVDEGAVEVKNGEAKTPVAVGGSLVIGARAGSRPASVEERADAEGWKTGTFSIVGRPLRDVLPELHRWYGLTVLVPDPANLDRPVTVRASLDSTRQALKGIEKSTGLQFGYVGQNMVFQEAGKAPAKAPAKAAAKR
jgi:ferric-dicitrate binding protein FerR (iron transport regulator)